MSKKILLVVLITSLFLVSANICVLGADNDLIKSRMRLGSDIETLDPAHLIKEYDIALVLYSKLLKYKPGSSEVVLDAAQELNVSEDGKIITFKLKEGIQFHKGYGELTAEDVKFSFERIINPDENSEYSSEWKTLDHVEVTGKYSGKIILKEPLASLLVTTLPYTSGSIISKKAYQELGQRFATNPVGSGPYYLKEWIPEQKLVLERFEDYYDPKPDFKTIELYPILDTNVCEMNFDKGDLDVTEISLDSIDRYRSNPDVDIHIPSTLKYYFIGFNDSKPPFNDIRVRKAMRYAINIEMIIVGAFNNVPKRAYTMIPEGILGHWDNAPKYEVNLEKAKQLLNEAGYSDGFETTFVTTNDPTYMNVAQIVKENLKKVGIDLQIKVIESSAWYQYLGQESHPGMFYETFSLTLDPGYWVEWFTSAQIEKWNFIKWSNEKYDQLAKEAALEMNTDKRAQMYIEMQKLLDQDAALIWITHGAKAYVSNKKVEPVFLGHYNQYRYWEKQN